MNTTTNPAAGILVPDEAALATLRAGVREGRLRPGEALPSSRHLAETLLVHRDAAPTFLPLVADEDPIISHLAVRALSASASGGSA